MYERLRNGKVGENAAGRAVGSGGWGCGEGGDGDGGWGESGAVAATTSPEAAQSVPLNAPEAGENGSSGKREDGSSTGGGAGSGGSSANGHHAGADEEEEAGEGGLVEAEDTHDVLMVRHMS